MVVANPMPHSPTGRPRRLTMDLKHVKGIGPSKQEKLKAAGVGSVEALARCDPAEVGAASGIPVAAVKEYKQKAAALSLLEDLKGVGPATVGVLARSEEHTSH